MWAFSRVLEQGTVSNHERQWSIERGGGTCNVGVKSSAFLFSVLNPDEKEIIAFGGFCLDGLFRRLVGRSHGDIGGGKRRLVLVCIPGVFRCRFCHGGSVAF